MDEAASATRLIRTIKTLTNVMNKKHLIVVATALIVATSSFALRAQGCDPIDLLSAQMGTTGIDLAWSYTPSLTAFFYGFEDGSLSPWTSIDADGDSHNWEISLLEDNGHESQYCAMSASYLNSYGALHPDNYFVSPLTTLTDHSVLGFWVAAQDAYYPSEHYGVAISTGSNTDPADFTTLWEETLTAKSCRDEASHRGMNEQGAWYHRSVDLSQYAGQRVYIAFRHFNCTDMFFLCVDDIELSQTGKDGDGPDSFKVYRSDDGESYGLVAEVPADGGTNYSCADAPGFGTWHYRVTAVYSNDGEPCESEPVEATIEVLCDAPTDLQCRANSNNIFLGWDYFYEGDHFFYDFDGGDFGPWTQIDADGDGHKWEMSLIENTGHNESPHYVTSASYDNSIGSLYPDNYLVSPRVKIGGYAVLSFWAAAQDESYPAEHYGVAVSTLGNTNPADFTTIWEETMIGKGQGRWYLKEIDLGAYMGKEVYLAIRHFGCSDNFMLDIDEIRLSSNAKDERFTGHFNLYRGHSLDAMELYDEIPFYSYGYFSYLDWTEPGEYYYRVTASLGWGEAECESEPAHALDNPDDDYVSINYLTVGEGTCATRVYPNPTQGVINLMLEAPASVSLYDAMGQCLYQGYHNEGSHQIALPMKGIGLLHIEGEATRETLRVVGM